MNNKKRVLMAMSGGLDSSIAAMMLIEQGYDLVGITMKTWDYAQSGGSKKETGCCSLESINDARQIAVSLGFPHYVLDIRDEFNEYIVKDFIDRYLEGLTPNPCILCNTHIKWDALLRRADQLSCDFLATGHYAQIKKHKDRYVISKSKDENKDQTYVLWGLSQDCLKRTLFPLGSYTKDYIRQLASKAGFKDIANKKESYEICFIPDDDYRGFLKRQVKGLEEKVDGGKFVDTKGNVLGKHKGYPFYTIGQRKGLNIAMGEPMYVKQILPVTNTIVLGKEEELYQKIFTVNSLNCIKYEKIDREMELSIKIRYKSKAYPGKVWQLDNNRAKIELDEKVKAITPGQSAVFYENDDVVGGGFIDEVEETVDSRQSIVGNIK